MYKISQDQKIPLSAVRRREVSRKIDYRSNPDAVVAAKFTLVMLYFTLRSRHAGQSGDCCC